MAVKREVDDDPACAVEPMSCPARAEGAVVLPAVLKPEELATLLRVNRKTVYEALARNKIPGARRFGRTYRIATDAVLAWLRAGGTTRSR
jgi:excisionase family DNA binding protein